MPQPQPPDRSATRRPINALSRPVHRHVSAAKPVDQTFLEKLSGSEGRNTRFPSRFYAYKAFDDLWLCRKRSDRQVSPFTEHTYPGWGGKAVIAQPELSYRLGQEANTIFGDAMHNVPEQGPGLVFEPQSHTSGTIDPAAAQFGRKVMRLTFWPSGDT